MVAEHLGRPLTAIPDPFGTHESYGAHMNARLQGVPRRSSASPTPSRAAREEYRSGRSTRRCSRCWSGTRRSARSCCRRWGRSGAPPTARSCRSRPRPAACCRCRSRSAGPSRARSCSATRTARLTEVPVTDGHCKMQWKCDWALRWAALDVDYEMSGKDLINSVKLSTQICRMLDGVPPRRLHLRAVPRRAGPEDQQVQGQRADHRGVAALRHAARACSCSSTASPRKAKRLHFDVIPQATSTITRASSRRSRASCRPSRSATRSGTSTTASRRSTTDCRRA